jgi:hypothetical protein
MKKAIIIEEEELAVLSLSIAERVLDRSEKFYGFTIHSRETGKELGEDVMLDILVLAIREVLEGEK